MAAEKFWLVPLVQHTVQKLSAVVGNTLAAKSYQLPIWCIIDLSTNKARTTANCSHILNLISSAESDTVLHRKLGLICKTPQCMASFFFPSKTGNDHYATHSCNRISNHTLNQLKMSIIWVFHHSCHVGSLRSVSCYWCAAKQTSS